MAYFEVQVEPDGTDAAQLLDSDNWMLAFDDGSGGVDVTLDIFVWNGTDTPVDVYLLGGHGDIVFNKDPSHYNDAQTEEQYRSVETSRIPGDGGGPILEIFGLAPGSFFPFVASNSSGTTRRRWLDADSCTMSTAGHGTNIFNGQRVYVIGHHA